MKKRLISVLLALCMVMTMTPAVFAAEETTSDDNLSVMEVEAGNAESLKEAIKDADDGKTISIPAGIYDIGSLVITKAVSIQGAGDGETILTGSMMYKDLTDGGEDKVITIEGITLKAPDGSNHQGLCWSTGVEGYQLNVTDCEFEGWEYAIGVNSGATKNTLNVSSTDFSDTWCAISAKTGNTIAADEETVTTDGDYAIQVFGTQGRESFDGYYETVSSYKKDAKDGSLNTPDAGGVTSGEGKVTVATPTNFASRIASANDGDTIRLTAGTYNADDLATITKRVNLEGAGADKTTIVGTVKYQLAAVTENANAALSVSGINFTAGEDALQGLVFTGTVNTEQRVDISVSDCAFNGWTYGIAMHSHVNGSTLTVSDNEFNTWCGINFNKDPDNKFGQVADNTLKISTGNTFNCSYAVEEFDNGNAAGSGVVAEDNYYETAKDYVDGTPVAGDIIRVTNAIELQKAIDDAGTTAATIELAGNITLSNVIIVPKGVNITIEGNGNTISYPVASPKVAFTGAGDGVQQEGIPEDVTLTINDVIFQNTTAGDPAGYAVLLDFNADGTKVILTGCTFENLYCGVYVNPVTEATITPPTISITNSTYTNTTYGYSVDEVTNGAIVGGVETIFTGNTGVKNEAETWYNVVATVTSGDVTKAYQSWEAAFDEATAGDTITLQQDIAGPITINKTITLEGNGKTITAESDNAITVTADGVILNNVTAISNTGDALVVSNEVKALTVEGGHYEVMDSDQQGAGTIVIGDIKSQIDFDTITVKDAEIVGPLMLMGYKSGALDISGNTISFNDGIEYGCVGILVFMNGTNVEALAAKGITADSINNSNNISLPNQNEKSDYVQIAMQGDGSWEFPDKIPANSSVAKIDNNYYNTLQAAVDAVGLNETITLLKNCNENITVSREVTFIIENGENSFTGSVSAGNGYRVTENNGIYIVEKYTPSSSGGGGGGSVTAYAITVEDSENGQVEANRTSASRGSSVTLTVTPDEGYELSSLTVTDADGNEIEVTENDGTYRFTMPSSKVTVTAEFAESSENPGTPEEPGTTGLPFTDVVSTDWYYDAVAYAYENDLMNGISSTQFNPNGTTTRGMIATILYRLEGEPEAPACDFTDVAAGQYYTDAIAWAAENHLVNGYGDGTFGPNDNITREQMSALLYRYAEFKGYDLTASGDLSGYTDASQISDYAVTAMQWATAEGLVNGMGDGTLAPRGNSTRAQIATILMRFLENIA